MQSWGRGEWHFRAFRAVPGEQNPEEERVPCCQPLAEPGVGLGAARGLQFTSADRGVGVAEAMRGWRESSLGPKSQSHFRALLCGAHLVPHLGRVQICHPLPRGPAFCPEV